MDRMQLIYAILQLRFDNYRTHAGMKAWIKLNKLTDSQLMDELTKWKRKRGIV